MHPEPENFADPAHSSDEAPPSLDDLDPVVAAVLAQLHAAAQEAPAAPWSLARLSKRSELAMSTLRRTLAALQEAGLVHVSEETPGRPMASLTEGGVGLCASLFAPGRA